MAARDELAAGEDLRYLDWRHTYERERPHSPGVPGPGTYSLSFDSENIGALWSGTKRDLLPLPAEVVHSRQH